MCAMGRLAASDLPEWLRQAAAGSLQGPQGLGAGGVDTTGTMQFVGAPGGVGSAPAGHAAGTQQMAAGEPGACNWTCPREATLAVMWFTAACVSMYCGRCCRHTWQACGSHWRQRWHALLLALTRWRRTAVQQAGQGTAVGEEGRSGHASVHGRMQVQVQGDAHALFAPQACPSKAVCGTH